MTEFADVMLLPVQTTHCGVLHVYVQGNLEERAGKTVILTVHDIGTNHKSFIRFCNHPSMADVKAKTIFLHVCVPGQEDHSAEFVGDFPTLTQIGEDLLCVLEKLDVKSCIGFGEGAGANIIARFAMEYPNRIMAIILVHCTSTTAGILEYCKDKIMNVRLENGVMFYIAIQFYIEIFRFHSPLQDGDKKYLLAFSKRSDISSLLGTKLDTVDALLVSGGNRPHLGSVYSTHKIMNKKKTTLLIVDNVCDVMTEAPDNLARSLILLCKGCGVLSGVAIPGMERQRTLSSSMEEADRPRRLSVTNPTPSIHWERVVNPRGRHHKVGEDTVGKKPKEKRL
ncbi:unnamed protein product, partial [Mesorhabditis belari]|uniref:Ndr n=1 Tax=Mesorhabditis belari TaxID=2138241 RepID=A0AAF3J5G3_9BILA